MSKDSTPSDHFSPNATLAAIGLKLQSLKLFEPIEQLVSIQQKQIDHAPTDKLKDALIAMLAGAHGICEINTLLRSDPALQRAFGRQACAEQSTVQDTLDACSPTTVAQMQQACDLIFRRRSLSARHNFKKDWFVADGDLTGLPCGPKAEGSGPGYLSGEGVRRGRQLARMVASQYGEVVTDLVFAGNTVMTSALRPLVETFERTLSLDTDLAKRERTILRFDASAGSLDDVNWLLARGYQLHGKDISTSRASALATTVTAWYPDPKDPDRFVGRVGADSLDYVRTLRRIAIKWRLKNGHWRYAVLHSTLEADQICTLMGERRDDEASVLWAYAHFYDQRGGGVEVEIKQGKQTGMRTRQKKLLSAQSMVQLLTALAHNIVVWSREWVAERAERVRKLGLKRWIRDVLRVSGRLRVSRHGRIKKIVLNQASAIAREVVAALNHLLAPEHIPVRLGEL